MAAVLKELANHLPTSTTGQLAVAAAALGVLFLMGVLLRDLVNAARLGSLPGPPRWPIVGNIPDLLKEPWLRFFEFYQQYGGIYKMFIWGQPLVVVSDPELVREIFLTNPDHYPKNNWSYSFFEPILGEGLVTSSGEHWRKQRRLLRPPFEAASMDRLMPVFRAAADRLCAKWSKLPSDLAKQDVELDHTFRGVTLEVISEVALGLDPEQTHILPNMFELVIDELNQRMFQPWRAFMPIELHHRKRLSTLNQLVRQLIAQRRELRAKTAGTSTTSTGDAAAAAAAAGLSKRAPDMLDLLLNAEEPLTETQIADELKTMLLAGHETSSMMLTWATYLLCKHPAMMARCVREVDAQTGGRADVPITFEMVSNMKFMDGVLNEALRLLTPVPVLAKEAGQDLELGGHFIPKGMLILISVWSLHHATEVWGPDAEEFNPDRWDKENESPFAYNKMKNRASSFIPFAVGARDCIGRNLALVESKVILASVLQKFNLRFAPHQSPDVQTDSYIIPVRPAGGIHVVLTPRA